MFQNCYLFFQNTYLSLSFDRYRNQNLYLSLPVKTHPVPLKEKEQGWGSSWGGKLFDDQHLQKYTAFKKS
ncbi:MAG TPA: hypothetical protein DCR40_02270 [Prolixibacteraceae bacterium]|nr:hypothetical protein [Prolixibacteraceae bacterium]